MALIDLNFKPTNRQLRQFGWMSLPLLPLIAWSWSGTGITLAISGIIGLGLALTGTLRPAWLKYPFIGLSLLGWPIGVVVGECVLLLIYFVIFLPIGLLFRLLGRDALQLKLDRTAMSYWQKRREARPPQDYYRQF